MRDMDRRTFLLSAGRWLAIAALAPTASGCARVLRWSDSQGGLNESDIASSSEAVSSTTTTEGAESTTTTLPTPQLAVISGESPDLNVRAAVAQLGGMERFVKRGAKVVVKPNVLTGRAPEYAVCTNPLVVGAIVRMCYEAGADHVTVLDNPTSSPRSAFQEAGITRATQEAGGTVKYLTNRNFETVSIPDAEALDSWPLVTDVFEADTLINVPICKHHGGAGLTLSMKNLMGIMGGNRGRVHTKMATKLADLSTIVKPQLVILDAYRTLFRNGPGGGNLKDVRMPKLCVAGTDQVAIDAYGCKIMGWDPMDLPTVAEGVRRGLGSADLASMNIYEGST